MHTQARAHPFTHAHVQTRIWGDAHTVVNTNFVKYHIDSQQAAQRGDMPRLQGGRMLSLLLFLLFFIIIITVIIFYIIYCETSSFFQHVKFFNCVLKKIEFAKFEFSLHLI